MIEKIKRKIPKLSQWRNFLKAFPKNQKKLFLVLFALAILSLIVLDYSFYITNTQVKPAVGGEYREAIVGQPRFVNPLYLSNNDTDKTLVELIFGGLLDYTPEGNIKKELAKSYKIKNEGKLYEFTLKDDIFWHDGKEITTDDIIFTVNAIQTPQYKSPLKTEWSGIKVKKKTSKKLVFKLDKPFASFKERVATLKILPKHVFKDVSPQNFPWKATSKKYLIGSGPYKVKEIIKDSAGFTKKIKLIRNKKFPGNVPFVKNLTCFFYKNTEAAINSLKSGKTDGLSVSNPNYLSFFSGNNFEKHKIQIPRYFAVFFNLKNETLKNEKIRKALSLSIDKRKIINEVFKGKASKVDSPILSDFFGYSSPTSTLTFNKKQAKNILSKIGYKLNKEKGIREKQPETKAAFTFDYDLSQGDQGEAVRNLQKCLSRDSDIYPEGKVTGYFGPKTKSAVTKFQEKFAKEILLPLNLKGGTGKAGPSTREKLNEFCKPDPKEPIPLEISITTKDSFPLNKITEIIKKNWKDIGVKVSIKEKEIGELQTQVFKNKNFDSLVFGEALGMIPDPFPFWHSSQIDYPGLNITSYNSDKADKLLEKARETSKQKTGRQALEKFQDLLLEKRPARFLLRGNAFYFLSKKVKGDKIEKAVSPSERFTNVKNWYIDTKRVW